MQGFRALLAVPLPFLVFAACGGAESGVGAGDSGVLATDANTNGGESDGSAEDAGKSCTTAADCGVNTTASCARVCQDGSNACTYACSTTKQCVLRGCPEDSAPSGCMPECGASDVCVKSQFNGGAALPVDDAGMCPEGDHAENGLCVSDPVFACEPKPASCGIPFDCSCASVLCKSGYTCSGTTQHEVDCNLDAP